MTPDPAAQAARAQQVAALKRFVQAKYPHPADHEWFHQQADAFLADLAALEEAGVKEARDHGAGLAAVASDTTVVPADQLPHDEAWANIAATAPHYCSQRHLLANVAWEGNYRRGTCACGRVLAWSGKGQE